MSSISVLFAGASLSAIGIAANGALEARGFVEAWHGYWGALVLVPATLIVCWLSIILGKVECLRTDEYGVLGYRTDQEPWHGVVQNCPQYAALHSFLLLPVLTYCLGVNRLLIMAQNSPSKEVVIALLLGFITFAAGVIAFPLNHNMAYVRDVDNRKDDFACSVQLGGGKTECEFYSGEKAAKAVVGHVTLVCISVFGISVLLAGWLLFSVVAWVFK